MESWRRMVIELTVLSPRRQGRSRATCHWALSHHFVMSDRGAVVLLIYIVYDMNLEMSTDREAQH